MYDFPDNLVFTHFTLQNYTQSSVPCVTQGTEDALAKLCHFGVLKTLLSVDTMRFWVKNSHLLKGYNASKRL